jgi:hypothetical protein
MRPLIVSIILSSCSPMPTEEPKELQVYGDMGAAADAGRMAP